MTRRIFALAPAVLAAQTPIPFPGDDRLKIRRPKNGQCPICGTVAPKLYWDLPERTPYELCTSGPDKVCVSSNESRRIDCDHCGCTFRQWAEGKEPKR